MSTFTPGPWKWWTSCSWRRLRRDDPRDERHVIEPYVSRSDGHPDLIVSEADMALISAAPDMYEALKAVVKLAQECIENITDAEQAVIDAALSVLSKAEGREG